MYVDTVGGVELGVVVALRGVKSWVAVVGSCSGWRLVRVTLVVAVLWLDEVFRGLFTVFGTVTWAVYTTFFYSAVTI